jgi:hypothetical protein
MPHRSVIVVLCSWPPLQVFIISYPSQHNVRYLLIGLHSKSIQFLSHVFHPELVP